MLGSSISDYAIIGDGRSAALVSRTGSIDWLCVFTWWFGALIGLVHGTFVLVVGMPVLPGIHPRMASELNGPTVLRQLEPPGFLAANYGVQTPVWTLAAHLIFGAMLGGFSSAS